MRLRSRRRWRGWSMPATPTIRLRGSSRRMRANSSRWRTRLPIRSAMACHEVVKGLIHRYRDRVLLKIVQVCAIYCRFCFRREMVGPDNGAPLSAAEFGAALDYIRSNAGIWEVILSGGDPLVMSPRRIGEVTAALAGIDHVKVLRWHTRVPVVAPERVTGELVAALRGTDQAVWMALHVNHPSETGLGGARSYRAARRCRGCPRQPERAAQGHQRRSGDAGGAAARAGRGADQALLSASSRPGAWEPVIFGRRSPRARR